MLAKHSRHISLTGPLAEWVDSQIFEGEYPSVSDLIRTGIRFLRGQEQEGRAGADGIPSARADNHV